MDDNQEKTPLEPQSIPEDNIKKGSKKSITFLCISLLIIVTVGGILYLRVNKLVVPTNYGESVVLKPVDGYKTIIAVGDIACDPTNKFFNEGIGTKDACQQKMVATAIENEKNINGVLILGDIQYDKGELEKYKLSFVEAWKDIKPPLFVTLGNHEYGLGNSDQTFAAFSQYFPAAKLGEKGKGYYSAIIGDWKIYSLNSNCEYVSCNDNSPQINWLNGELAADKNKCSLAMWHHPVFTSGEHRELSSTTRGRNFWKILQQNHVDVILNGHDHNYERFAKQSVDNKLDPNGIREIVSGAGGATHYPLLPLGPKNSEKGVQNRFGYTKMKLYKTHYTWQFIAADNGEVLDSGSDDCI